MKCQKGTILLVSMIIVLAFSSPSRLSADGGSQFVFATKNPSNGGGEFSAVTSDKDVIRLARQQLSLPIEKRDLMINGTIARGNEGNKSWSWHFVPGKWSLVEVSMELCDGTPEEVENDLPKWVDNVKRFCPWNSYVLEEIQD